MKADLTGLTSVEVREVIYLRVATNSQLAILVLVAIRQALVNEWTSISLNQVKHRELGKSSEPSQLRAPTSRN